jgi:cobaltochelatase CobS
MLSKHLSPGSLLKTGCPFFRRTIMSDTLSILSGLAPSDLDAGQVFSGSPSGKLVRGYAAPNPFTPAVDANYIFHEHSRDLVVWFINPSEPLYVFGPTGAGKSSCLKQLAARLNYPSFEVTGHSRLEFPELIGHLAVHNGDMVFEYGPLALAMKFGGLFLLNEIDLLEPSTAAGLNGILDGQALCVPENEGELIKPHEMFRFAATANSNGASDESGLYQGVLRQNIAFMDRFIVCELGYPKPEEEEVLLAKANPKLPEPIRKRMVEFAGEVRRLFMGEQGNTHSRNNIEITLSTRTLLRWANLTLRYQPLAGQGIQPVRYALDRALGFRACPESRAMLHELAQRMFPDKSKEKQPGE